MLNLINRSNEIVENQQNLNFIKFVNFRELAITNFKHNLSINHYKSINYLTVISKYICMRIDLLHSLWYLLNFLWGLLRPKHFNLEMKQYYSGAREEGKLCTFPHPYLVTELSADACCRVSVVYCSQLMCTVEWTDMYCNSNKAGQGINFRSRNSAYLCLCKKCKQVQYWLDFCFLSCQKP